MPTSKSEGGETAYKRGSRERGKRSNGSTNERCNEKTRFLSPLGRGEGTQKGVRALAAEAWLGDYRIFTRLSSGFLTETAMKEERIN